VFPPNSPEPPPEIRVVRYDGSGSLFERDDFNLWVNEKNQYLWSEINYSLPAGAGYELTEVEEFTTAPVTA
jgi:hypothetical protein